MPPRPATIRVVLCATAGIVAAAPAAAGAAAVDLPFAVVDEATDFVLGPPVIARAGAALGPRAIVLYTRPGVVGLVWVRTPSRGHPKGEGAVSTRLRSSGDASHSEYLRRAVPGDGPVGSSRALDLTVGAEFSFTATPTAAFAAVLSRRPLRLAGPSRPNGRHGRIADHAAARTSVVVARRPEGWVGLMLTGTRADRRAMLAAVDWTALDRDLGDI
jgi:hypothetical protein